MDENQIYYLGRVEKITIVLKQNSKATSPVYVNSLENYIKNAPIGVSFCGCQSADDNPRKDSMTICMTFVNENHAWGMQYLFSYEYIYWRVMNNGVMDEWNKMV